MADNVRITAATGPADIATDDIGGGIQVQRIKLGYGPDGTYADVHAGSPLPAAVASGTAVGSARVTLAETGVAQQLPAHPGIAGLTVRALRGNIGIVYVGGPGVSAGTGFELRPGEAISLDVADSAAVHVVADIAADGVCLIWVGGVGT